MEGQLDKSEGLSDQALASRSGAPRNCPAAKDPAHENAGTPPMSCLPKLNTNSSHLAPKHSRAAAAFVSISSCELVVVWCHSENGCCSFRC